MGFLKLLVMLLALAYVVWQLRQILLGRASQGWRSVKGKVTSANAEEHMHHDRYGGEHYSYSAKVTYTYQVGGRHFESTHFTYEPTTGLSEDTVTQLLDGITDGAEVDVFYDPLNWEHAVLIPGSSSGNFIHLALSIGLLALVTWLCFFYVPTPSGLRH